MLLQTTQTEAQMAAEESLLRFDCFNSQTAWDVAQHILSLCDQMGNVAIEITVNGLCLFAYYSNGTGKENQLWIERKRNVVELRSTSSLRALAWINENNLTLERTVFNEIRFAVVGGGFPILLKSGQMIGSICVSGLKHTEDHKIIVLALQKYFEQNETV